MKLDISYFPMEIQVVLHHWHGKKVVDTNLKKSVFDFVLQSAYFVCKIVLISPIDQLNNHNFDVQLIGFCAISDFLLRHCVKGAYTVQTS